MAGDEELRRNRFRTRISQEMAMKVSEAMTRDVRVASPDETIQKAARTMASLDAGVLPVGEHDHL
jgi:CBS domain-containing protein